MFKVYLAGPITGLSYGKAIDWRNDARKKLELWSDGRVKGYSPLRHKEYLNKETEIADSYNVPLSNQRGITARDRMDCMTSDALLFNCLGANKPTFGTVMEMGWGDAFRKPMVLVMEEQGNMHDHAMIREVCQFRVPDLDSGLTLVCKLLLP